MEPIILVLLGIAFVQAQLNYGQLFVRVTKTGYKFKRKAAAKKVKLTTTTLPEKHGSII